MEGILVPITFFAFLAAVIILPSYFKSREKEKMQETIRAAIQAGQPLPPEVIQAVTSGAGARPISTRAQDFRKGVIWLCIAGGLATIGAIGAWYEGFEDGGAVFAFSLAAIPLFVGLAFIVFGFLNKDRGPSGKDMA